MNARIRTPMTANMSDPTSSPAPATGKTSPAVYVWLALGAVALVGFGYLLLWGSSTLDEPGRGRRHSVVGQAVTGSITPLRGNVPEEPIRLEDQKGKVVLVNFWAVWCPPCREELPQLGQLAYQLADRKDFAFFPICYDQAPTDTPEWIGARAQQITGRMGLTAPIYCDPGNVLQTSLPKLFEMSFPATMVLDKQGKIRAVWTGFSPDDLQRIRTLVDELLRE